MSSTQFDNIYHGLGSSVGKLRVASSGMAWKGSEGEPIVALPADDIKWAQWLRVARNYQLRVGVKDHQKHHFDGFAREDHDKLATLLKNYFSVAIETKEITFKGWNWGDTDFQGQDLAFLVSDRVAFELPLQNVANSNIAGRTEVSLEFSGLTTSKSVRPQGDEMVEIRFHVPGVQTKLKGESASDAGQSDDEEEISAAQVFHDLIKDKAEIGQVSGDMILSFEEVLILTPRGRYDLDMFPDFLRLRGKTYDYKIVYTSISRLFLLAKDDNHVLFILGLNTPIRQGQTRYSYLVMQFTHEEEITAELNMTDEQLAKYNGTLEKSYEKPTYEVVSAIFKGLTGKKIIGVGGFKSTADHPGIKANLKAVQGDLFILDKQLFFVSKQPLLIDFSDIHAAIFSRVGGGTGSRTFDLRVETRSGPEHTFSSIAKEEYEGVEKFLKASKLKVKSESVPDAEMLMQADLGDDDDEDEEMRSVGSDVPKRRALDDDDDSEDDEDFQASSTDEGSPSEDESDDSGAATASDASGDRDVAKVVKKKKEKKAKKGADGEAPKKKKKPAAPEGSDAEDDDDKPKASKPKPKPKPKAKKADDAMDVDEEGGRPKKKAAKKDRDDGMDVDDKPKPKPRPKPKAAKKKDADEDEDAPPKKKVKTSAD
ncbi:structure-specific recognition protein-domain-containing protein [Schizophyllum commune]